MGMEYFNGFVARSAIPSFLSVNNIPSTTTVTRPQFSYHHCTLTVTLLLLVPSAHLWGPGVHPALLPVHAASPGLRHRHGFHPGLCHNPIFCIIHEADSAQRSGPRLDGRAYLSLSLSLSLPRVILYGIAA